MRALLLAALLASTASTASAARRREPELKPSQDNWSALKMEATAIMGELKYQHGDLAGARETFRDSLNSSKHVLSPQDHVVGLDLYRTAELAARRGDFDSARQHLDILLSRFPDTEFAEKGEQLLGLLPKPKAGADEGDDAATPVVTEEQPDLMLGRLQEAARSGGDEEALQLCRRFLSLHAARPEAQEVRLLAAALALRSGDASAAARELEPLADQGSDAELRAKAVHLLAASRLAVGDAEGARQAVPDAAPRSSWSEWITRAQVFRAAAEERLGQRDASAARYRRFVASGLRSPVRAQALAAIAADWDRRGRPLQAAAALEQASREAAHWGLDELRDAADLARAHELYKARRFSEAAALYGDFASARRTHPQRALALFQQGLALKRLGRRERAAATFSELVSNAPQSAFAADANLQLGQLYTDLGAADKAVAAYERMAQSGEARGERESLLLIAQVHYNQKRFRQAIPLYWSFLERNPGDARRAEVEDLLLTAYWLGAREDEGLLKAIDLFPRHAIVPHIRWELGAQAYKRGDYARAARFFDRFASDYPRSKRAAESLFYLGEAKLKLGEPGAAAAALSALLARYPKSEQAAAARPRLGAALYDSGDYAAAAKAYSAAAVGAGAADALYNSALASSKAGRKAAALAAYEKLLARFPRHPKASFAWMQVAQSREAAGRLAPAADAYMRVTADGDRATALFAAGRIREKLRQTGLAVRVYEALRSCRPATDSARVRGLVRLGLLYELQDKPLKALPIYNEVLRLSARGSADFKTAVHRIQALTSDALPRSGAR